MIKLTLSEKYVGDNEILINPSFVAHVTQSLCGSNIKMNNGDSFEVEQSISKIKELIKEDGNR